MRVAIRSSILLEFDKEQEQYHCPWPPSMPQEWPVGCCTRGPAPLPPMQQTRKTPTARRLDAFLEQHKGCALAASTSPCPSSNAHLSSRGCPDSCLGYHCPSDVRPYLLVLARETYSSCLGTSASQGLHLVVRLQPTDLQYLGGPSQSDLARTQCSTAPPSDPR